MWQCPHLGHTHAHATLRQSGATSRRVSSHSLSHRSKTRVHTCTHTDKRNASATWERTDYQNPSVFCVRLSFVLVGSGAAPLCVCGINPPSVSWPAVILRPNNNSHKSVTACTLSRSVCADVCVQVGRANPITGKKTRRKSRKHTGASRLVFNPQLITVNTLVCCFQGL